MCLWRLLLLPLPWVCAAGCAAPDDAGPYVDIDYQVRCVGACQGFADDAPRAIAHADGEDGFAVKCSLVGAPGSRYLNASVQCTDPARCGGDYGIELIHVGLDTLDPGGACEVRIREGANTYSGSCTYTSPTTRDPCTVMVEPHGTTITGSLLCRDIPNLHTLASRRTAAAPASGTDPAVFHLMHCAERAR